jgi:hypothetical protein
MVLHIVVVDIQELEDLVEMVEEYMADYLAGMEVEDIPAVVGMLEVQLAQASQNLTFLIISASQ